jgi:hypothetical protein
MIAQIDEQQIAVVTLAVDPAGQFDPIADMALAELSAAVSAIGVHRGSLSFSVCWLKVRASASLHWLGFVKRSGYPPVAS